MFREADKKLNEKVYKKLLNLNFRAFRDGFTVDLMIGQEFYANIEYIKHAENALSRYCSISEPLSRSKQLTGE